MHIDFKSRHHESSNPESSDIKGKNKQGVFRNRYVNGSFAENSNQQSIVLDKDENGPETMYHKFVVRNNKQSE